MRRLRNELLHSAVPVARGALALALITFACYSLRLTFSVAALLYLIAIVLNCLDGSSRAAVIVSFLAAGLLDYFFTGPLFSFTVLQPVDVVALVSFLVTSVVITRLASRARQESKAARHDRQNIERLYELASRILTLVPVGEAESTFLEQFLPVFGMKAVCLFDAGAAALYTVGDPQATLSERTRRAYISGQDTDVPGSDVALRCLRAAGRIIGAVGFEGLQDSAVMAGPLAAIAAASLERVSTFRRASLAAAQTEADALRTVLLDALAHEFKTPLAAILTAVGGLREAGPLSADQSELAEVAESEASRLGNLTSRLVRLARLERNELTPTLEPIEISALVSSTVERYSRLWPGHKFALVKNDEDLEVLGDAELLRLAFSQLLDNACKYSPSGSEVAIEVNAQKQTVDLTVGNEGLPIAPGERHRIFERFYRSAEGQRLASGSGLGLYVARKIAIVHGGSLALDAPEAAAGTTIFRLTLPVQRE
jgi:two-component system sensor histidine kinase KdpD